MAESCQELSFWGHFESEEYNNRGNYKELLYLISKYDEKLASHLRKIRKPSRRHSFYLSNRIQNDLIDAIQKVMLYEIQNELNEVTSVAIYVDETSDLSAYSQLSTALCYVTKDCVTKERFIGFNYPSTDRPADG
ncbi:uncharacterized protein LOC106877262 [Octopus bimaculoides]|uniref:uncharacterized protein LOC106877262 n=1 Tax=Octopus bimaculoides TaxID=37653 RepID=UPI00071D9F53|nr:uncharacterized protein LOC106877262 [Octopus bimaculoides]|eukprot:XP_014781611.1 PREDICTED: uncharacterized protein LOC106877262 [Octopus bimaculoides]